MPELPEVQTIVDGLNQKIVGRKIVGLWTDWPKYFRLPKDETQFRQHLIGKKIIKVFRRAKNVLIELSNNHLLLIHQKISGHLLVGKWKKTTSDMNLPEEWQGQKWIPDPPRGPAMAPMNRFIRLILFLDNGQMLALSDLRRFAKVLCAPPEVIFNLPDLKNLGPEPLLPNFTFKKFRELFKNKRGRLKSILMDQVFISGIGNIYADEILWVAKIHPLARAEKLKDKELKAIYRAMKFVLKKALRLRGSSVDDYRDAFGRRGRYDLVRYVYRREDEPCPRCGTKIKRLKIGGRSAHFCPNCQRI
jgi:formamidopyrimidine-DNA glycosylase